MNVLKVDNVSKYYGNIAVVKDLSFAITKGECFGLLGNNGAGKTTTIECILQVNKVTKGKITILETKMNGKNKKIASRIGVQFQENGYPDKLKVIEACRLTAALYKKDKDYLQLLKEFNLTEHQDTFIDQLSGGQKQRLSVLLALLPKPEMLFLDELTTGLDTEARRSIWKYIEEYKEQGNSILLTSHYMDEVEHLCDRIGILKQGRLVFIGTIDEAKKISHCTSLEEAYIWFNKEENEYENIFGSSKDRN